MKKRDLANILTAELALPRSKANDAVNLVFEAISDQLSRGREVNISGFGVFGLERPATAGGSASHGKLAVQRPVFKANRRLGRVEEEA
ncbi:HU family DNA-binding protein (plasmid) [Xanthomonas citri pv. citri]|uniref:HU family DNA-binding protein n=1 Tax=Xanthomonas citri TaxID=346 RepID=UPI00193217F1|nr:HU family DNA-binding protein [Xanthomonas citri]QRD62707.1 HU family DNA-binding protein [Xanthomonas citri pv. citri]QRD67034.1 HU family DNA-binding protein [Xanthomonas citri pv. citri]QRD71713.1 HU family DNA-binding protein [Xanthomonas citri pv. citri]